MGVRVNPNTAIAVAVSYVQPVFAASWIDIQIDAEVTFPDRLVVEVVSPLDAVFKTMFKTPFDGVTISDDEANWEYAKNPAETISVPDVVNTLLIFQRAFFDTLTPADLYTSTFIKPFTETLAVSETSALDITKPQVDSIVVPDLPAKSFAKVVTGEAQTYVDPSYFASQDYVNEPVLGDYVYAGLDEVTTLRIRTRNPTDDIQTADAITAIDVGLGVNEFLQAIDIISIVPGRSPSDVVSLTDNMDGNLTYQFVKTTSDLQGVYDTQVVDMFAQKADNVLVDDAGLVAMTDYCDISYFSSDYVGTSRAFT